MIKYMIIGFNQEYLACQIVQLDLLFIFAKKRSQVQALFLLSSIQFTAIIRPTYIRIL